MLDLFRYDFMVRGLAAAVITGATCSLVGVFVVLRGLSFIGAGIAHGAFAGVALAFLLGVNPVAMSLIFAVAMVVLINSVSKKGDLKMDASIGVVFSFAMALAIFFVGLLNRYTPDLMAYLFGNLLAVSSENLIIMGAVSMAVGALFWLSYKELQYSTFDAEMAEVSGIPSGIISLGLLILTALTIVISLQSVGELLVVALMILPATTAYQLTNSLNKMLALSVAFGVSSAVIGLIASYYLETPSGATIVMLLALAFAFSALFSPKRRQVV